MQFAPSLAGLYLRAMASIVVIGLLLTWMHFNAAAQPTKSEIAIIVFVAGGLQPILLSVLELLIFLRKWQMSTSRLKEIARKFRDRRDEEVPYSTIIELLCEQKSHWQFANISWDTTPIDRAIDAVETAKIKQYRRYSDLLPKTVDDICTLLAKIIPV